MFINSHGSVPWISKSTIFFLFILCLLVGTPLTQTQAAGDDPWQDRPQMQHVFFTQQAVGFVSNGTLFEPMHGKSFYYIFDRQKREVKEVEVGVFNSRIPQAKSLVLPDFMNYGDWSIDPYPKSSSGDTINVANANQSEGDTPHFGPTEMQVRSSTFTLNLESEVASALEIIGQQAWVGTAEAGTYRSYGGVGIIVIGLNDGKEIRRITTKDGLSGNLINLIRNDPYGSSIWVATNYGVDELDQSGKILYTYAFKSLKGKAKIGTK